MHTESLHHGFRHEYIVAFRVAHIGEDLSERLFVVLCDETLVFVQTLLVFVDAVDVIRRVIRIDIVVKYAIERQPVVLLGPFIGIAHCDGGHGEDEFRQAQDADDVLGHIDSCAKITGAESFLLRQCAEVLREEQGVGKLSYPGSASRCSHHFDTRLKSAQKVSTTGAAVTMGWLKCAGASSALIFGSVVATTLYSCILPIVGVRMASSSNLLSKSSGMGVDWYFRIERRSLIFVILYLFC